MICAAGDGMFWLHDNDSDARARGRGALVPAAAFQHVACASHGDDDTFALVHRGGGLHQLLHEREEARRERQRRQAAERERQRRRRMARSVG